MTTDSNISLLADGLMRAVIRSGVFEGRTDHDRLVRIMREELKALIVPSEDPTGKYEDERQLAMVGQSGLAMASLAAECIRRILAERETEKTGA